MHTRFLRRASALLAAVLLAAPVWAAPALKVLSASPRGPLSYTARQAVSITFNQPVAKLDEKTAFSSENCPLSITPKVAGTCRFSGTQTLLFEPAENWPEATRFSVSVPEGFASSVSGQKLAQPYRFSFTTNLPTVEMVQPTNNEHWISLNPTLYVLFSTAVNLQELPQYAELSYQSVPAPTFGEKLGRSKAKRTPVKKTVPLTVRPLSDVEYEKNFSYYQKDRLVAISALQPLQKGTAYTLTLKAGLKGKTGTLGMANAYQTTFVTYPDLTVLNQVKAGCLPYTPTVDFSTPVRLGELAAAARVTPVSAVRSLSEQEKNVLGYDVVEPKTGEAYFSTPLAFLNLEPGKNITVTLDKNLRDIYGNTLGKEITFTVSNTGYCPAVDFSGGLGVLESYVSPRLPIDLMNTPSLPVRGARFNKENFIPFDKTSSGYCAQKPLTSATFSGNYTFKDVKDRTVKTFIDLQTFRPTAQDSIIFSQVRVPAKNGGKDCWVSSTDNLTDVGVTLKTSPNDILVWATSLKTGEPLPQMAVELRGADNKVLWTGTTDEQGLAWAPGWTKLPITKEGWGQPEIYAFVTSRGGDAVISSSWNQGLEPWRFNLNYDYNPQAEDLRTVLFADRGIYRPGETVYLKGVVRRLQGGAWSVAQGLRGTLTLTDSRGEEALKKDVTVSAMGTFDVSFAIPKTAYTGAWDVSFVPQVKGQKDVSGAYLGFQVEAVKQADFKVNLRPEKPSYLAGQTARFLASAQYNFGSPLANAKATWTLRRYRAWFEPKGFDGYTFTPYFLREDEYKEDGKILLNASGQLDAQGATHFEAVLPQVRFPINVYGELGVQAPSRQELFARGEVLVHPADFYLGAKLLKDQLELGDTVSADILAVTPDGKRTSAEVTAAIRKEQWFSVRKTGLSGRLEWVSEKQVVDLPSQTLTVGEKGATLSFTPEEAGNYFITLTSTDAQGRTVTGGFNVFVYGKGQAYWKKTDDDFLTLKQNKNSYKPGQTARISVQSPYEHARALVTVEREGILEAWTTELNGGADYVEVPIKKNYLPNVYVSVTLVRGRSADPVVKGVDLGKPQGKVGYVNLNVEPSAKKITPTLKLNKKNYRPGDEVTLKITAKSHAKDTPAELVVMVVDEGVLALTNYQTPNLFDAFYGSRPMSVFTADNRMYVVGQRNFGEKGENRGGGGEAMLASKMGGVDLRTNFAFTPYFNAVVKTDKKGRATVRFKLPDNLTKFRVMAVALTADEFGSAEANLTVSKPVMVTSNLPRFARKGDRFSCGAVVYNYEDKKGVMTVSAQARGALLLTGPAVQEVTVPLGAAREVTWACEAAENGPAEVAFSVRGNKEADGVLGKLTVSPVEKQQTLSVYASTKGTQEELLDKPGNLNAQADNRVTLSLASTALLNLKGSMVYLLTYPYDCLEQKMSKILPVISGEKLLADFKLGDVTQYKKQVQEILDLMPQYQYASGGYGYWQNALPDPYVTAYALEVAQLAKQAGYTVPQKSLEKAAKWLEGAFNKNATRAYAYSALETDAARAYSLYVLALYGRNVESAFNTLYAKRGTLPLSAKAYLLKAAQTSHRSAQVKAALAQELFNHIAYTTAAAYFDEPETMPWLHMDNTKVTALCLDALLYAKADFAEAFKTASWLLTQLNAEGHWNNTSVNAAVFQALNTYYKRAETVTPDFSAEVKAGAKTALSAIFKGRSVESQNASLPFGDVYADQSEARVTFAKTGAGTLYYTLSQVYEPRRFDSAVDAGFTVSRAISTLDGKPVTRLQAGERYQITLTVKNAASRHFVVLEDFIPAGFEIVNTSLATEADVSVAVPVEEADAYKGSGYNAFERNEKYDDRIAAFADYLPAGTHTYSYVVSAAVPGTFAYPSAWASQMYEPAVFGRNATQTLVIE